MNKMKEGFSNVEKFTRKHTRETLTAAAVVVATISSWGHFFVGTIAWAVLFMMIGAVVGIFFTHPVDRVLEKICLFSFRDMKMGDIVAEVIKIAVALFVPFLYFGYLGLMAGTSYHYYCHPKHQGK